MAIETQPEQAQGPGGGEPAVPRPARPWWRRPAIHTALAGAVLGYLAGHLLGNFLGSGYQQLALSDSSDLPIVLGYLLAVVGWLAGLGVFNDLRRQVAGRPAAPSDPLHDSELRGLARYFRYSLDHKVVGIQYLVGMIIYFCTAGLFAMAIRTELLSPGPPRLHLPGLRRDRGRARDDDDDADDLGHPRPVRQLPGPAHDRVQAGGVPPDRGAVVLAHPVRVPHLAVRPAAGRVPVRLDRLRAAVHPVHRRGRLLRDRVRPDGHLDHPGRVQHHHHGDLLPGAGNALEPAARCSCGRWSRPRSSWCWPRRSWSAGCT